MTPPYQLIVSVTLLALLSSGCAGHSVKFAPYIKWKVPPTEHAVPVTGSIEQWRQLSEKAALPHNTPRDRYLLGLKAFETLTDQLGSTDYVLIGEVFGGGNAWATHATLTSALCKKGARHGGNVVMIFNRQTVEQPYAYSTPGYSTTTSNAYAYGYGNYATAHGTSRTTHLPGRTYVGTMYKPQANAFVFRHVSGAGEHRRSLLNANDDAVATAVSQLETLFANRKLTWDEGRRRSRDIIERAAREMDQSSDE